MHKLLPSDRVVPSQTDRVPPSHSDQVQASQASKVSSKQNRVSSTKTEEGGKYYSHSVISSIPQNKTSVEFLPGIGSTNTKIMHALHDP